MRRRQKEQEKPRTANQVELQHSGDQGNANTAQAASKKGASLEAENEGTKTEEGEEATVHGVHGGAPSTQILDDTLDSDHAGNGSGGAGGHLASSFCTKSCDNDNTDERGPHHTITHRVCIPAAPVAAARVAWARASWSGPEGVVGAVGRFMCHDDRSDEGGFDNSKSDSDAGPKEVQTATKDIARSYGATRLHSTLQETLLPAEAASIEFENHKVIGHGKKAEHKRDAEADQLEGAGSFSDFLKLYLTGETYFPVLKSLILECVSPFNFITRILFF